VATRRDSVTQVKRNSGPQHEPGARQRWSGGTVSGGRGRAVRRRVLDTASPKLWADASRQGTKRSRPACLSLPVSRTRHQCMEWGAARFARPAYVRCSLTFHRIQTAP